MTPKEQRAIVKLIKDLEAARADIVKMNCQIDLLIEAQNKQENKNESA